MIAQQIIIVKRVRSIVLPIHVRKVIYALRIHIVLQNVRTVLSSIHQHQTIRTIYQKYVTFVLLDFMLILKDACLVLLVIFVWDAPILNILLIEKLIMATSVQKATTVPNQAYMKCHVQLPHIVMRNVGNLWRIAFLVLKIHITKNQVKQPVENVV